MHFDDLPHDILDVILRHTTLSALCRLCQTCEALRDHVLTTTRYKSIGIRSTGVRRESNGSLPAGGRDPHWTRDLRAAINLFSQPIFERLHTLHFCIDSPLFSNMADTTACRIRSFVCRTLRVLIVESKSRHFDAPNGNGLFRFLLFFPNVRDGRLVHIKNVGGSVLEFLATRCSERLVLRNVGLTANGKRLVRQWSREAWPTTLHLELSSHSVLELFGTQTTFCFPRDLVSVDFGTCSASLCENVLLGIVLFCRHLRDITVTRGDDRLEVISFVLAETERQPFKIHYARALRALEEIPATRHNLYALR